MGKTTENDWTESSCKIDKRDPWLRIVVSLSGKELIHSLKIFVRFAAFAALSESWLADFGWSFNGAGEVTDVPDVEMGRRVMLESCAA